MAKILIVDDDEDIRELLMYNLKREGHDVSCAENGLEALDMIQSNIPDLIILDVMMPKMDGIEFCDLLVCGQAVFAGLAGWCGTRPSPLPIAYSFRLAQARQAA